MTKPNVDLLIEWLGHEGAVAGLDKSHLTNADLMIIAREKGLLVDKRTARRQIAIEIVMGNTHRIEKSSDQLMQMSRDEILRYFSDRLVSNNEIRKMLFELGIGPSGKVRIKLAEFAANEISDLGMYQRVAQGSKKS